MSKILTHAQFDAISLTIATLNNAGIRYFEVQVDAQTEVRVYLHCAAGGPEVVVLQCGGRLTDREEMYTFVHEFLAAYNAVY